MNAMKSMYVAPATEEVTILGRNAFMQDGFLQEPSTPSDFGGGEGWDFGD